MKKAIISLLLFFALPAFAYYNPGQPSGFVNDYTGTLAAEQKQALENKLSQFEKETSNEIAVVMIKSLQDDTIENFAVKLFEDWKIGKQGKDNGVLVLVAKEDKEMRIEVGYGLEGALTDAQAGWIVNQLMKPAFKNNDFFGGLDAAVEKIMAATKGEYVPSQSASASSGGNFNIFDFGWLGVFLFVWLASILGRSKSWWAGGVIGGIIGVVIGIIKGFLFFGIISIAILAPLGLLFDFIVSKKYQAGKASGHIPWWIGGGRGGHGGFGGSSGFGGFGGGFSGGGGASGRW
ncbi:MAG: TPM domain-containing protein [Patescibacteria group bacterium]|nr:TPM domain-containing protein [Patescibacteria group bacterium]